MKWIIPLLLVIVGCTTVTNFEECVEAGNPVMESFPRQCTHDGVTYVEEVSPGQLCEVNGGNWLEEFSECEGISEEVCNQMQGNYDECASACRNDPDAEFCTLQCVQVCEV